ncbi:cupin domain-containing protein [Brevundimonas staleyi]|uniref:Cupin domain-containing protein n=1 Tax=Brevundimonas staleyi TaxID=74326 RepID=A0ABW0FS89_9CAUL
MARQDFDPANTPPDGRPASKSRLFDPDKDGPWKGSVPGLDLGSAVTVLAYGTDEVGIGPRLHVHPYDETFVIVQGRARFFVGDAVLEASAGEVVLGPRGVPHRFENLGPGRLQTIDIHHSPEWIQTDLE